MNRITEYFEDFNKESAIVHVFEHYKALNKESKEDLVLALILLFADMTDCRTLERYLKKNFKDKCIEEDYKLLV